MADLLNLDQLKEKAEQIVKQLTGNKDLIAMLTKDPATGAFYVADGGSHRIRKITVVTE